MERYFTYSLDTLCIADTEGNFIRLNPEWERVLGYSVAELEGRPFMDFVHPDDRDGTAEALAKLNDQETVNSFENRYRCSDGVYRWIEWRAEYELKLSEERYRLIFENSMEGILLTDPDGKIISANPAASKILGFAEHVLVQKGREAVADLSDPRLLPALEKREKEGRFRGELLFKKKSGEVFPAELTSNIFIDQDGNRRTCIFFHDISEEKRKEQEIITALHQKDFLMKELNHRVKNNLSLVSSLISLKNAGTEEDLSDIKYQIQAIGLVHERLLQTEEVERIRVREYLQDLLENIFSSVTSQGVEIVNRIEDVNISTKTVISLGLIVNEAATNAIKHGFAPDEMARFTAALTADTKNKQYILTLSNTGSPFPEEIDLEAPATLGLQLISTLTDQLGGTVEVEKNPSAAIVIKFPLE